jgi:DNA polymerase-3 subunit delta
MLYKEPTEMLRLLKQKIFAPVYFLQSEEPFFIDQVSDYIESHALEEKDRAFNQIILYGKEVKLQDVLGHARKFPMMAERQLVLVKEAQEINDLKPTGGEEGAIKWLFQYLEKPQESTILVFAYREKMIDGRSKLYQILKEKTEMLHGGRLYDNQVPDWLKTYTRSKGYTLSQQAADMLASAVGSNISRLSNEIDKLCINVKEGDEITPHQVEQFVGVSRVYNVFELQKALAVKNPTESMKIALSMAADVRNTNGIQVVIMLFGFFQKVLHLKRSGLQDNNQIAKAIGVQPFFVKDYVAASNRYSLTQLIAAIHALRQADTRLKGMEGNSLEVSDVFKEMVYQITLN